MSDKKHPIAIVAGERFYTLRSGWFETKSKGFTTIRGAEDSVFGILGRSEIGEELVIYDIRGFWMASKPDDFVRFCKSTGWFEMDPAPTPVVLGNDGTFRGEPVS